MRVCARVCVCVCVCVRKSVRETIEKWATGVLCYVLSLSPCLSFHLIQETRVIYDLAYAPLIVTTPTYPCILFQIIPNQEQVKLTNIGESRKADLPNCLSYEAGDYVYLPPEVRKAYLFVALSEDLNK